MNADLIVTGATVITMDDANTEAEGFAVRDGRIVAVGDAAEMSAHAGRGTEFVDLGGATVVPGLIDAHAHLENLAYSWEIAVDCRSPSVGSIDEMVERLRAESSQLPAGAWVLGQGNHFQDAMLVERRYPDREDLDRVSREHPVVVRFSLHLNIFNSCALELLGVDRDTPDAPGGRIEHDPETGEPTGRTFDMYTALGGPEWPLEEVTAAVRRTQARYHAVGVTCLGDFQVQRHGLDSLLALYARGQLTLRVTAYPKLPDVIAPADLRPDVLGDRFEGVDPDRLRLGGIKFFLDGGMTASAAALHEPYEGQPGYCGEIAFELEELRGFAETVAGMGYQTAVHAIGDRALDTALEALGSLPARNGGSGPHRIEHAGNLFMTPERIAALRDSGIQPVPQPSFIHTTGEGYKKQIGPERARDAFPFRRMIDEGLRLPGNSDAVGLIPEQHAPMFGIWAAVTRIASSGKTIDADQAVTVDEALRMYTRDAAHSLGLEDRLGSIEPGKLADFTVLGADPRTVDPDALRTLPIEQTWVGGARVFPST